MSPKSIWSDAIDELFELGKSTVQQTAQTAKTLTVGTAKKAIEEFTGTSSQTSSDKGIEQIEKAQGKKQNHTPLDTKKLEERYKRQDQQQLTDVRQKLWHYFNIEKQAEKKAVDERKREEEDRKRKDEWEKEEKKKKEEKAKQQQAVTAPKGKERRSIFSPKKMAKRSQMETRVGTGKQ
jgi:hypothetical protein